MSYPFGYGLSYAAFDYSKLKVHRKKLDANATLKVTADVTNTGDVRGEEVVQLYVTTPGAPAEKGRPIKRLEGFQKISLRPHETERVTFDVDVPNLAFFDESAGHYTVDQGAYGVELGASSADIRQKASFTVTGALDPVPAVVSPRPVVTGDAAIGVSQRVRFPANATIDPQLTVSMTDESIYGYVTKGQSTPLPKGLTVRYSSNRPDVVSVGHDGAIRTRKAGAATVTATVCYHGTKTTGSFVVYVR